MILFRVGKLIDGTGAPPLEGAALLIDGDRILAVGRQADIAAPEGAKIVEAPDSTLIPGLIDVHVHLAYSGHPDLRQFRAELVDLNYASVALRAAHYARQTLRSGFTAVRDMHAPGGTIIDLRDAVNAGHVEGPRIMACGMGLTVTGGHMDQGGFADHVSFRDFTAPCDGPDGFRKGVRTQMRRGADFIKVNPCVGSRKDPDRKPYRYEMTPAEMRAACEEAHEMGFHVGAHTSGGPPLRAAVEAGCDTIEHGHWIDDETLDLMAERGTFLVPTLLVNKTSSAYTANDPNASWGAKRWGENSLDAMWERLSRARARGVRIGSGSDAGFLLEHGPSSLGEMECLVEGGFSPVEAISAATATNADIMELEAGRLLPGKLADLVLVAGDPSRDLSVLRDNDKKTVFLGGKQIE
ncbi:amidohydrolase family protein [Halovulum sp. GXIMD14794]